MRVTFSTLFRRGPVYPDLSSTRILTMEWIEGVRLVDAAAVREICGREPSELVDILVQCSLRQMLDNVRLGRSSP